MTQRNTAKHKETRRGDGGGESTQKYRDEKQGKHRKIQKNKETPETQK